MKEQLDLFCSFEENVDTHPIPKDTETYTYVDFISDQHIFGCMEKVFEVYESTKKSINLSTYYKNRIDPFKINFDIYFNGLTEKEIILGDIERANAQRISMTIGYFHENLLGGIKGLKKFKVGDGYDIKSNNDDIFADIKNKHNTVTGGKLKTLYRDLEKYIEGKPNAKAFWVQINAKSSFCMPWTATYENESFNNPNVYKASADRFYALVTQKDTAFAELCAALPQATEDFMKKYKLSDKADNISIYDDLVTKAAENEVSILTQMINENYRGFIGFPLRNSEDSKI